MFKIIADSCCDLINAKKLFEEKNRLKIEALNKQIKLLEVQRVKLKEYAMVHFFDEEKKTGKITYPEG